MIGLIGFQNLLNGSRFGLVVAKAVSVVLLGRRYSRVVFPRCFSLGRLWVVNLRPFRVVLGGFFLIFFRLNFK